MSYRVVGFGGTASEHSSSKTALSYVLHAAAKEGATTELIEARGLDLPIYGSVQSDLRAQDFAERVHAADALVISSPLYHGSISGLIKNALDWLELLASRSPAYLSDKPVGLIAVAGGSQSLMAIQTLENVVRALRGWPIPYVVPIDRAGAVFGRRGEILDEDVGRRLDLLASEVVRAAGVFKR